MGAGSLTLVNGRTFSVGARSGDLTMPSHGVVFEDLRMLSQLSLSVESPDGEQPHTSLELLSASAPTPFSAVMVSRIRRETDANQVEDMVIRRRWIGRGLREDVQISNLRRSPARWIVKLAVGTDFAHLFDVKAGRSDGTPASMTALDEGLELRSEDGSSRVRIVADPPPWHIERDALVWTVEVPPRSDATIHITFEPIWDGVEAGLLYPIGAPPEDALPAQKLEQWERSVPTVHSREDPNLATTVRRCLQDLASLRMFDVGHPGRVVVAAGAPWFMTLFGRDSLLTAWMALPFAPELARGVLFSLAELQGTKYDPASEEQPGKIIHELRRRGGTSAFSERGRYYGTADATPLFVMLASEAYRWGALSDDDLDTLWPNVLAATDWILRSISNDERGFVTYQRSSEQGLSNQGWKDSWDGINFADGTIATGRLALVEVQGYCYAALHAVTELSHERGLAGRGEAAGEAERLRKRFEDHFWIPGREWYAVGLDADGRQIDALTTNPGHALWCGIADPDRAAAYLDHLASEDMWTGWGLRTLAASMGAYDPLAYHNGSVWPHDTAICAAGAARYGRWDLVDRISSGAGDAAAAFGGRPPELFAGISSATVPAPVPYPSSCSPQAWASASILMNLRTLTGAQPDRESNRIVIDRPIASKLSDLTLVGILLDGRRYRIELADHMVMSTAID